MIIKINNLSENEIIYRHLRKLNFDHKESFNFKNDGALIKKKRNAEIIVTNDIITESIDFFKDDAADSVAQKIMTCNLSDLSSMGAIPYSYTLSLSIPKGISREWISVFVNKLLYLQKKYKVFLLGGDICKSSKICISANFFGYAKKKLILLREFPKIGEDIWVTGNIGESYLGLQIKKKKLKVNKLFKKYYINKYLFPKPCMIGEKIAKVSKYGIDISDGFLGDLSKLLGNKLGADISLSNIPFSANTNSLIKDNKINPISLLNGGDDYELIFTTPIKNDKIIRKIGINSRVKITKIGRIVDKKGIIIDNKKLTKSKNSYQYFF